MQEAFLEAVAIAKEHILAGDIFQLVLSQRFERRTFAEPFEVYRALRVVNPSPYMVYLQVRAAQLVPRTLPTCVRICTQWMMRMQRRARLHARTPHAHGRTWTLDAHTHTRTCTCTHARGHTHASAHKLKYMHAYMLLACVPACMLTHAHTHTDTHTHTQTHACKCAEFDTWW